MAFGSQKETLIANAIKNFLKVGKVTKKQLIEFKKIGRSIIFSI